MLEYVVLTATCPTFLNTQLPSVVQSLLGFQPKTGGLNADASRSITFFARQPGVVRVVTTLQAQFVLGSEYAQNRYLGKASVASRGLFNIPAAVQRALRIRSEPHGDGNARITDDMVMWLVPAPEYFEYAGTVRRGRPWSRPSGSRFTHLYLAKSLLPADPLLASLTEFESKVEAEEWQPRVEALQKIDRSRRAT